MNEIIIYDCFFDTVGILSYDITFDVYRVAFEEHNLFFKMHPTEWAKGIPEDEGRFQQIGKV